MSRLGRSLRREKVKASNQLSFYAPLTYNLLLTKGQGVATFTRTTIATCWCYLENAVSGDSLVLQTIPSGIPRFEGARFIASNNTWSNLLSDGAAIQEATLKGVSIEVASKNLFLQSATLATQSVTTTATTYTVSFTGTGTVTLSGTFTGSLIGAGVNTRVSLSFTATAGTLTSTVSGSVTNAQLEALPMATSYIPTTTASLTRNADVLTFPNSGNVSNTAGTVLLEATPAVDIPNSITGGFGWNYLIDFGLSHGYLYCRANALWRTDTSVTVTTPSWIPLKNTTYKIGSRYGSVGQRNWLSGTAGANGAFDGYIGSGINMTIGGYGGGTTYNWGGTIKNLKIYKKVLSDAQITSLTA